MPIILELIGGAILLCVLAVGVARLVEILGRRADNSTTNPKD